MHAQGGTRDGAAALPPRGPLATPTLMRVWSQSLLLHVFVVFCPTPLVYVHVWVWMCGGVYMYVRVCACVRACVRACVCACMRAWVHACVRVCGEAWWPSGQDICPRILKVVRSSPTSAWHFFIMHQPPAHSAVKWVPALYGWVDITTDCTIPSY